MILGVRFDSIPRIFWTFLCSKTHGFSFLNQMKIRASNTKSPIVYIIEADLHQDINSGLSGVRTITLRVISCAKVWES